LLVTEVAEMADAPTIDRERVDEQFARILDRRDLRVFFQPVVHLASGDVVGYEALVRGPDESPLASPDALMAAAERAGRGVELDWAARSLACRTALEAGLSNDVLLFLNIEPIALESDCPPDLWPDIERAFRIFRVVLEVTERSLDRDPGTLLDGVERQRPFVAGIALDDVGLNPASLAMLSLVVPAVIKLDRSVLVSEPNQDVARVLNSVQGQVDRTGAIVLAEGIEDAPLRDRAIAYGAQLGQGFLFGYPGPLEAASAWQWKHYVPLIGTPPPIVRSPFEALAGRAFGPADDALIVELTRYVAATANVTSPMLSVNLVPGPQWLDRRELERLRRLADDGVFVAVLGPGIEAEVGHGIRGTGLRREILPTGEWASIIVGPGACSAVLARQTDDGSGSWLYGSTQDWPRTVAAARSLVRLLGASESSVWDDGQGGGRMRT
jgi:EAL domain-containing protein (putative c-di-GMP-specific phosphodiesterase class I)